MRKLLHNNRGETLIEVLASVLITALSVALLFTCVMASSKMDDTAKKKDIEHYNALSGAEARAGGTEGINVEITRVANPTDPEADPEPTPSVLASATPPILIYGGEEMYSYKGK